MNDTTVLVTGATDGLGRALAGRLAGAGATLLLHGRDERRTARAVNEISQETGNQRLFRYTADFARLSDVRTFAERLLTEHDRIDVVINNAGIGTRIPGDGKRMESADGIELRFAVNYLAGFLLTRRLVPLLRRARRGRVINVSSAAQTGLDFDDLMLSQSYDGARAYGQSKLAQIMFSFDLAADLAHSGVTVNAVHPASFMPTKMVLAAGRSARSSLETGLAAVLRLLDDPTTAAMTGEYFDGARVSRAHGQASDQIARKRLHDESVQLVG